MRLYYTGASPDNLRKAREHAPSHSHGYGWTPQKMTPHDDHYFLDNGAFGSHFDGDVWVSTLEEALTEMPTEPDFVVLPDVNVKDKKRWVDFAWIGWCRVLFGHNLYISPSPEHILASFHTLGSGPEAAGAVRKMVQIIQFRLP